MNLNESELYKLGKAYFAALGRPVQTLTMQPWAVANQWSIIANPGTVTTYYDLFRSVTTVVPAVSAVTKIYFGYPTMHVLSDQPPSGSYNINFGYYTIAAPFAGPASASLQQNPFVGFSDTGIAAPGDNEALFYQSSTPIFLAAFYSHYNNVLAAASSFTVYVSFNGVVFAV